MAHNARTQPDGTWIGGYQPTPADWADLDRKVFQAINGDHGGTWAPAIAIEVDGGAGGLEVTGPTVIDYGGSITFSSGANVRLADGDWPRLGPAHTLRSRTILTSCIQRQATPDYWWTNNPALGGIQSIACSEEAPVAIRATFAHVAFDGPRTLNTPSFLLPLRVHDGARLASATLSFRVTGPRTAGPIVSPMIRIVRVDTSGNITTLKSLASGADVNGYAAVTSAATGPAWFASGAVQSFTYVCDQNNVVDRSQYAYFAQVVEEVGALYPIAIRSADGLLVRERKSDVVVVSTTNQALTGSPTIDGYHVGASGFFLAGAEDRILLVNQTAPEENGIWIAPSSPSGAWFRSVDLSVGADFTPGFLVKVANGTANGNSMWECRDPASSQQINLDATRGARTPVHFQRRTPRGNVYIAVAANFDQITDMRWQ